jgi:hypothetical protein
VRETITRKSDVNDATWVSELLAHGLVRASFVPEPAIQQLRGLLRTRKQLVREKASHVQRLQKTLEEANIKIESVLSDVMGRSGRAMIQALIDGESDLPNWLHLHIGRCVRRQQPCAKRCMDALNVTIVFCLDCICSRWRLRSVLCRRGMRQAASNGSPSMLSNVDQQGAPVQPVPSLIHRT